MLFLNSLLWITDLYKTFGDSFLMQKNKKRQKQLRHMGFLLVFHKAFMEFSTLLCFFSQCSKNMCSKLTEFSNLEFSLFFHEI